MTNEKYGTRREGLFASLGAWINKFGMSAALFLAGVILVSCGFDVDLGNQQAESTIIAMRAADAIVPAIGCMVAVYILFKYPLTKKRMELIRKVLERRRGAAEIS